MAKRGTRERVYFKVADAANAIINRGIPAELKELRDSLLTHIEYKTGITVVRETDEQIRKSAEQAKGGKFSVDLSRRNEWDNWRLVNTDEYAALASQVKTWGDKKRKFDVFYSKDARAVYLIRRDSSEAGRFDIVDVMSIDLPQNEIEARIGEYRRQLVDAESQGLSPRAGFLRAVSGVDNPVVERSENGGVAEQSKENASRALQQDGGDSERGRSDADGVFSADGSLFAYRVGSSLAEKGDELLRKNIESSKPEKLPKNVSILEYLRNNGILFKVIEAKHGSPHRFAEEAGAPFGRFRDDKMGTGEGAQAFGWGHYLTNREGIAREYAEAGKNRYKKTRVDDIALGKLRRSQTFKKMMSRLSEKLSTTLKLPTGESIKNEIVNNALNGWFSRSQSMEVGFINGQKTRLETSIRTENDFVIKPTRDELEVGGRWTVLDEQGRAVTTVGEKTRDAEKKKYLELGYKIEFVPLSEDRIRGYKAAIQRSEERIRNWKEELALYEKALAEVEALTKEDVATKEVVSFLEKRGFKVFAPRRHLYTAEFDDAGLLDWRKPLTAEQQLRIAEQLREEGLEEEADALADDAKHGTLYTAKELHENDGVLGLNSPQERSKLLHRAGFVGHKFPAQSMGAGDYSKGTNYVIYDESALNIVDRVSWLQRDGVVYGYFDPVRKELHLNEDFADFDTPIHEWTHVWWSWVSEQDSRLTDKIVDLVKRTEAFAKLKAEVAADAESVYHGLDDAALAQEVFSRFVGKRGEEFITKSEKSLWAKLKEYAQAFFKTVLRTLGLSDAQVESLTLEDVQNMALRDLFSDEVSLSIEDAKKWQTVDKYRTLFKAVNDHAMNINEAAAKWKSRMAELVSAQELFNKSWDEAQRTYAFEQANLRRLRGIASRRAAARMEAQTRVRRRSLIFKL